MTATTLDQVANKTRIHRSMRLGRVISDKGDKTITVLCDYMVKHPKYGKYYRRSTKVRAHDEKNEAKTGDVVELSFARRLSKTKFWRLVRVVKPGNLT